MPAKKRINKTTKKSKSKQIQSRNSLSNRVNSKSILIFSVIAIAVIGAIVLFRSKAANTNFEAESASLTSGAVSGNDINASGGKYVQFNQLSAAAAGKPERRFPGDPNPLKYKKAYWGLSQQGGTDPAAKHEQPIGKPVSLRHYFFSWGDINSGSIGNKAKSDIQKGRLPLYNVKASASGGWAAIANGSQNAQIDKLLGQLESAGGPVWIILQHEPENDVNGSSNTAETWKAMQVKFRERMRAYNNGAGTKNIAFMPDFMAVTFIKNSGTEINKWWPGNGVWDVLMISAYCMASCRDKGYMNTTQPQWPAFVKFAKSKNIPMGVAEWSVQNTAAGVTAMKAMWNYGFDNKEDLVGYAYFDSDANRPSSETNAPLTYLRGDSMTAFTNISRDDPKVQRIADLNTTTATSTTYGSATGNINVPSNGTYRLWVRMSAPDTTNNAIQAKLGASGTITMGNSSSITPNTWQWIDYTNGDTSSKTSFNLTAGTFQLTLTGIENGVKIDRVILTNEGCTPIGTGENCTTITDTTPPSANFANTQNGQTVSGKYTFKVNTTDNVGVTTVNFRLNDKWQDAVESAPYQWTWDTTKVRNGTYTITARVRDAAGNVYDAKVSVNVKN